MPRRPRRPTDLRRVAAILADGRATAGWVPQPPGEPDDPAEDLDDDARNRVRDGLERVGLGGIGDLLGVAEGPDGSEGSEADEQTRRLDADLRRARRPGLLTVPDDVRSGRRSVSTTAVVSLLALVVAVGCAFVVRVLWAERSAAGPVDAPARGVSVVAATGTSLPTAAGTAPTASPASTASSVAALVVHVVGQVNRPGLVRLPAGSRVADAIEAAGGARRGADLSALNLARLVLDGEQVHVPKPGEVVPAAGAGAAGAAGPSGAAGGGGAGAAGALVSLNTADVAGLDTLPGVGPVLAQRILEWRTEHGRFTSVDELGEVSGIGDKLMSQLRPKVTL
ncbi:helix-hairpin-helix domain-containing protein [Intrasporangium sp. YIM S08009]|uniref:helix-hairpin-helix domain-containing protein n=1 Tax=Intrasporangium zincisolvens TaxID=3080018 RepID=UPI002B05F184|nr:helix-hairpin-helix domain-containing protein [Intrasporangium sp. YIM S08009]